MNIRIIITLAMVLMTSFAAKAQTDGVDPLRDNDDVISGVDMRHWNFDVRLGYSVGGTLPTDWPDGIRAVNSYKPKLNYRFGVDVEYRYNNHWGLAGGLYFERKGFEADATLYQYNVRMDVGGESFEGPFTGNIDVNVIQTGFTVPIQVAWWPIRTLKVKFGPYISIITDKSLYGYAYGKRDKNGNCTAYIRKGDSSISPIMEIGNEESTRGYFSGNVFNDQMRRFQWGLDVGCDWYFSRHWGAFVDISYGISSAVDYGGHRPVQMALHPFYGTFGIVYKIGR